MEFTVFSTIFIELLVGKRSKYNKKESEKLKIDACENDDGSSMILVRVIFYGISH